MDDGYLVNGLFGYLGIWLFEDSSLATQITK